MTAQALFYEQAEPLNRERHGDWYAETGQGYAFARRANAVPLTAVEFPTAAREYPIAFAREGEAVLPLALLGLRESENLFIGEDGGWDARYVPAYVRRYPFIFATADGGASFTLCVDEGYPGFNTERRGEPLFLHDGTQSAYLERIVAFVKEYQAQYRLTRDLCERLDGLDLFEPMQANIAMTDGEHLSLGGFLGVKRDRLKALDGDTLAELSARDELALIYAHVLSLENFGVLVDRLALARQGGGAPRAGRSGG